jgi:hypothetical protein
VVPYFEGHPPYITSIWPGMLRLKALKVFIRTTIKKGLRIRIKVLFLLLPHLVIRVISKEMRLSALDRVGNWILFQEILLKRLQIHIVANQRDAFYVFLYFCERSLAIRACRKPKELTGRLIYYWLLRGRYFPTKIDIIRYWLFLLSFIMY